MSGIGTPKRNLRIVWVDAAKNESVLQLVQRSKHTFIEESRAWPEVSRRKLRIGSSVRGVNYVFDGLDLISQDCVAQRSARLVMHSMIGQLIAVANKSLERRLAPRDLGSDDEESSCCTVGSEDLHYLIGVFARPIIDCEGNHFRRDWNVPENVRPSTLAVSNQEIGRLVNHVKGQDQGEDDKQQHKHRYEARPTSSFS